MLQHIADKPDIYMHYEHSDEKLTWCSGCGNYGIQKALIRALTASGLSYRDTFLCYDVGCNGNESDKLGAYTIHGLHGRVLPLAAGAALANGRLKVIAQAGDGATFSEGVNHLVHAVRNNYPITFICHNNENYGLTTGQASSATRRGYAMNSSPDGVVARPMNLCEFVLSLNPTFVARSFSGDVSHMSSVIEAGLNHDGFSFIEIMQVCPTYNKATSQQWFWERINYIEQMDDHDASDIWAARKLAADVDEKIALGVLYKNNELPFQKRLPQREAKKTELIDEVKHVDISGLMAHFA